MDEMTERQDTALLEAWSSEGSEKAFAALALRYGGLLYHAALRRTGRTDLAGEAAQNALLILARKAPRLRHLPTLAGWLHRTACYEASKLLRREHRHEARMKRLHSSGDSHESDSRWQDALPLLDQALDALPEKDRQVIFLKYFDGLSFEEIARRFGGEPAAWRQRGSRAIERLRLSLGRRGVAVSSSALASGIGTSLSQAAPPALAATLAQSPATAAAALSWQTLALHSIHLMKIKPTVTLAVILLASSIPVGMQAKTLADTRKRIALLESGQPLDATGEIPPRPGRPAIGEKSSGINLLALADALRSDHPPKRLQAQRLLTGLDSETLAKLLLEAEAHEMSPDKRGALIEHLFPQYCRQEREPGKVIALAARIAPQLSKSRQSLIWYIASGSIHRWTNENPGQALAWYHASKETGVLDTPDKIRSVAGSLFSGLHATDPAGAIAFYRSLPDNERQELIRGASNRGKPPEILLNLATEIEDPKQRQTALLRLFLGYPGEEKTPAEVLARIERVGATGNDAIELLATAAMGYPYQPTGETGTYGQPISRPLNTSELKDRLRWLREASAGLDTSEAIGAFFANTAGSSVHATREVLDTEWAEHADERMLAAYISRAGSADNRDFALDAIARSRLISDPDLREDALRELFQTTGPLSYALELAREGGLSDEEIQRTLPQDP